MNLFLISVLAVVVLLLVSALVVVARRKRVPALSLDTRSVEQKYLDQFVVEPPLERVTRQRDEYFRIIELVEKEKNRWIEMWRTQAGEHLGAQAMLERHLGQTRQVAARAIEMLNKMRKEAELPKIDCPEHLVPYDGEPVGLAEAYAEKMLKLRKMVEKPVDGVALRDQATKDN